MSDLYTTKHIGNLLRLSFGLAVLHVDTRAASNSKTPLEEE